MVCVVCNGETRVINSRLQKRSNQVWRRRQCLVCNTVFTTGETVQYANVWRVKGTDDSYSLFSRDKLLISIYRSCQHRPTALADAAALTDTVISKLQPKSIDGILDAQTIVRITNVALNRFDQAASMHFEAFHKQAN
jgi:transcriptional repressor NrdR